MANKLDMLSKSLQENLDLTAYSQVGHTHNYAGSSTAGGAATSATKLATARKINGTDFNGTGDITTANWGTARTITIGSKGKTVDGSGNVSWTLAEIGAAASSHTHNVLSVKSDNYKQGTDLPSTYDRGETVFFSNNPTNKFNGITYCTVHTIKGYNNMACIQYLYPYNSGDDKVYYRTAQYNSDAWRSWGVVYSSLNKPTPADIGAAASSHGTHVTYATATPSANGTAAIGTSSRVAREDHVHPLQSTVSGNAGSADKWSTARTLTIGNTGKSVDGTANVSWSLSEIGAAASGHTHNYAGSSSAGGAANSVKTSLAIKLNGGTTEGTNLFTFNGSTAKTVNITPASIGAAASSHGTHLTFGTATPKVAGTAAVGTSSYAAREDHVHPAQTSVSGNAGTATKLATARTIQIGNQSNTFDGSGNITYTLSGIGAASVQTKSAATAATAQWYRIAQSSANIINCLGLFEIEAAVSGKHSVTLVSAGISYGVTNGVNLQQLSHTMYSTTGISKARIVYHTTYNSNYAYLEVYLPSATATTLTVNLVGGRGWTLIAPNTVGSVPSGYTNKEITFVAGKIVSNIQGSVSGNAGTATKLATARTITVSGAVTGSTSFDGSGNVTISTTLASHTHNYAGSSSAGGAATSANKVNSALSIQLNGGTATTFDGSAAKSINITPSSIGAAASSHGTHVTYSTTTPKVAGTAAVGSEGAVARGDHVHPPQTSVTGNAGTATKLATARTLTIGNTGKAFDGSDNVSWSLTEIGAAASNHTHSAIVMNNCSNKDLNTIKTAGWYYGYTGMTNAPVQSISVLEVIVYSADWIVQRFTVINANGTTYERHYYSGTTWSTWKKIYDEKNKPTPADIGAAASSHGTHVTYSTAAPAANGTASAGSAANVSRGDHVHPLQTTVSGNAGTATKWQTARTLTIGNTGKSVDGSDNVTWSIAEIGALPLTGNAGAYSITGDLSFASPSNGTFRGVVGKVGVNDYWRVGGSATADNAGYMEIATCDDSNEPIYVRQYSGSFSTLTRTLTLLDASGNTSMPGNLAVSKGVNAQDVTASGNVTVTGTVKVGSVTMKYNDTSESLDFIFA